MAEVDFSNARLSVDPARTKSPIDPNYLNLIANYFYDSNWNRISTVSFTRVVDEQNRVSYIYSGTFTASGTEFYFGDAYPSEFDQRWRVSNITFSSGDTYQFKVTANLMQVVVPTSWSDKTWSGLTDFYGNDIWTDGNDIYYSYGNSQFVLDKTTGTWNAKTWSGAPKNFYGRYVWTDGFSIYYSAGLSHYVLSNGVWTPKTWYKDGTTTKIYPTGSEIWTNGTSTYYTEGYATYLLIFDAWAIITWGGSNRPQYGSDIWTDGEYFYYSKGSNQYVLNGSTWDDITWSGLTKFWGSNVWTDGNYIFHSSDNEQYILDKSTRTWTRKIWEGGKKPQGGAYIWTDGTNIYYSNSRTQYVLDKN